MMLPKMGQEGSPEGACEGAGLGLTKKLESHQYTLRADCGAWARQASSLISSS